MKGVITDVISLAIIVVYSFILGMFSAPEPVYKVHFAHPERSASYHEKTGIHCSHLTLGVNGKEYNVCYKLERSN